MAKFENDCGANLNEIENQMNAAIFNLYGDYQDGVADRLIDFPEDIEQQFLKFIADYFQDNFGNNH